MKLSKRNQLAQSRRKFLSRLGLGAGAAMLYPIANSLVAQAQGVEPSSKRFVVWLGHQGIRPKCITPVELQAGDNEELSKTLLNAPTGFTMPAMLQALEPHRDRMLLLDGFNNNMPRLQHTATFGALSCMTALNGGSNEGGGSPGGITIDQHIAAVLSKTTKHKSVLWGAGGDGGGETGNNMFASGAGKPEPHIRAPGLLYKTLFGDVVDTATPTVDKRGIKRKLILDGLRAEINTLQAELAASERRKLEHYLSAIEEFELRNGNLGKMVDCKAPGAPSLSDVPGEEVALEDWLETMNDMSVLALTCGMTNVVGVAANNGGVHKNWAYNRLQPGSGFDKLDGAGHEPDDKQVPQMNLIHNFHAGLVARFVDQLKAIPEGDGTAFDNTVIVYTTDNGDHHHSDNWRWPVVVIGDAGGALKSDGRFLRYPSRERALADFWSTISEALGVPSDGYAKPGNLLPLAGPLDEILA